MTSTNIFKILSLPAQRALRSYGVRSVVFLSLLTLHCDESLPPRDEPKLVLSVKLSVTDGSFTFREVGSPQGSYWILTPMGMSIRIQNDYSDVLQDTLRIAGTLEIWNRMDPTVRAEYQFGKEIFPSVTPIWVLTNGVLTLEPGQFASLGMVWGHYVRQPVQRPIWCGRQLTPRVDGSGEVYYVSDKVLIGVKAKVQIFGKVALLSTNEVDAVADYSIYPLPSSAPPDSTLCQQ